MKMVFSKVIFMDESQMAFDGPDGWAKQWVLSKSDVPGAKKGKQGDSSVMKAGIVN